MPSTYKGIIGPNGLPLDDKTVQTLSYSEASEVRPKNDQAIILELPNTKEIKIENYVKALLNTVNQKDITHLSRISKNRLCVYLTSAAKAEELVVVNKSISVDSEEVKIKYLVPKSVKVIISNAIASISNTAIKRFLTQVCGIKTLSSVAELKVNPLGDKESNILSFRRTVYIHPEDVAKLPSMQKFKGDGLVTNVFFDTDTPKCFICNSEDHFAKQCQENNSQTSKSQEPENNSSQTQDTEHDVNNENGVEVVNSLTAMANQNILPPPADNCVLEAKSSGSQMDSRPVVKETRNVDPKNNIPSHIFKRPLSVGSDDARIQSSPKKTMTITQNKQSLKKGGTFTPKPHSGQIKEKDTVKDAKKANKFEEKVAAELQPARALIDISAKEFPLAFEKVVRLIASSTGSGENRRSLALELIPSGKKDEVVRLLQQVHGMVKGTGTKRRITSLLKALQFDDTLLSNEDTASEDDLPGGFTSTPLQF